MQEIAMRLWISGIAFASMLPLGAAAAAPMTPAEIQATFFNGTEFIAASPSGVKYKMTFTADGKALRVPASGSGVKSEGTWKLNDSGYCRVWKGGKSECFTVVAGDKNRWSVMKGATVSATWSK
jgi:hypothetical protein